MNYKIFFTYWFPVVLWVGFTFWMSSGTFSSSNTSRIIEPLLRFFIPTISESTLHHVHGIIRKLAHVTEYFLLGLLLFRAFRSENNIQKPLRWASYSLLVVALFALGDEFHQSFVITRTSSIVDVGIDTFGGFLGLCVILLWHRARRAFI